MRLKSFSSRLKKKKANFELRQQLYSRKRAIYAQLHINRKVNNLVFTLTMKNGLVLQAASSGLVKFTKAKRLSPQAAEAITRRLMEYAKILGVSFIEIVVHTKVNLFVFSAHRGVVASGIPFGFVLRSKILIPHNGCKGKKKRRV